MRFPPRTSKAGAAWIGLLLQRGRTVLIASCVLTALALGAIVWGLMHEPFEYDYRNLRSVREADSDVERVLDAARATLTDTLSGSALAVLTPSEDQARRYRNALEQRGGDDYGRVRTVDDLLPEPDVGTWREPLVAQMRSQMLEVRPHVSDEVQATIDRRLPPSTWSPLAPSDLPSSVARPFTERDGTRGRLAFVEPADGETGWDGRYTRRWVRAARSVHDAHGEPYPVAGAAVVLSDIDEVLWRDGPKAVGLALAATVVLLLLGFRRVRWAAWAIITLLLGVVWMAGAMVGCGLRLNFLNFVSFPITFGNGADYGVNVIRRFAERRKRDAPTPEALERAVVGTGLAVTLCSVTTIIGYLSLFMSINRALNSFGAAMALSEVTCAAAALLVLPILLRRERKPPVATTSSVHLIMASKP